jgi:hypothetical protein
MMMLEIITSTSSSYRAPGLSSAPVKRDSFPKSVIIPQRLALLSALEPKKKEEGFHFPPAHQ